MIRTFAWAGTTIVLALVALAPAAATGSLLSSAVGDSDVLRLATAAGLWALLAGGLSVALARLLLLERRAVDLAEMALVLIGGAVAAAVAEGGVVFWMVDHYGMIQSEVAALIYLMAINLTVLTSGAVAALVTVGSARTFSVAAVFAGTAGVALAAVSNLPGIGDGISPSGPALALSFAASGGYAMLANYVLLRARRRSVD